MPTAVQLLALKCECEVAFRQAPVGIALRQPMAAVPDHHSAAAILALRNGPFERVVGNRVILDLDCQPLFSGHKARPARHRPAFHHAVELETQIVVQTRCGMLLNDKGVTSLARHLAFRLSSDAEIAFGPVGLQT